MWSAAFILLGTLVAVYIVPVFFPWSEWNCQHQAIDINTGRLRFSSYLFFMNTSERIEDSDLTKILPKEQLDRTTPEWHLVNTFSPGVRHSPHYAFHSAISQIKQLALWWRMEDVQEAVQQKTALHLLALWKHERSDWLAKHYLSALPWDQDTTRRQKIFATIEALAMPLVEKSQSNITMTVFYPDATSLSRYRGYLDQTGKLVRDGVSELWYPDGKIQAYSHYNRGVIDGRRFQWERNGKLSCIEAFRSGELVEYESENLERHSEYNFAQQIGAMSGNQPTRSETNQTSSAADSRR